MFQNRRQYLKNAMQNKQVDMVLIDSPSNLFYYTGFTGGEAMFLLPMVNAGEGLELVDSNVVLKQKEELSGKNEGYIITDSRYWEQVEQECPELTLVRLTNKGYSETLKELLVEMKESGAIPIDFERIAVEESMNLARYLKLCEDCEEYDFQLAGDILRESRMVKDEEELQKIEKAEAIGDAAFTYILDRIKPGVSEAEIALELEFFMKRQGASKLSFDTIVASGSNSSMPHAQVTERIIQKGDFVTMDFGCVYQGYCSDMTRTVAVGNPTDEMKKVYQIVLDANLRAMEGVRAGVCCKDVDAIARDYIREQGYGEYFGHGLGHGVGLDIHEEPRFSPKCDVITKENMVITDEPGIYLPGQFGVRIEDLVVVKKHGCQQLSHSEKKLIVL